MASGLDGNWQVVRAGGWLPPLVGVRKRIDGDRGWTSLGPLPGAPFDVVGNELRYRAPFVGFVDVIEPITSDTGTGLSRDEPVARPGASGPVPVHPVGFKGRATVFGREVGTFRLVRRR